MKKCFYCEGTGKIKKPNDEERFERIVDCEMQKGDFISYDMAEKKAYNIVGYTEIDCPYCNENKENI